MAGHSGHTTFFVRTLAGGPAKALASTVEITRGRRTSSRRHPTVPRTGVVSLSPV